MYIIMYLYVNEYIYLLLEFENNKDIMCIQYDMCIV